MSEPLLAIEVLSEEALKRDAVYCKEEREIYAFQQSDSKPLAYALTNSVLQQLSVLNWSLDAIKFSVEHGDIDAAKVRLVNHTLLQKSIIKGLHELIEQVDRGDFDSKPKRRSHRKRLHKNKRGR
jgi:hypothetical protein